jgi:outer membrane protein assembly factor BamB
MPGETRRLRAGISNLKVGAVFTIIAPHRHELAASAMRGRETIRASVIISGLLCSLAVPPSAHPDPVHPGRSADASSPVDVWSGWRGLTAQGRADTLLPTRWESDIGIRWKTPIPGRGHSSPIVFGDSIYVTTAYTARAGVLLRATLRLLMLGLVLALATLALRDVEHRCHPAGAPTVWDLAAAIAVMSVVLVLAIIGCLGDVLFDFARSNMRAWMASTVFGALCLALTAFWVDHRRLRLGVGLSAMAFAVFALAAFPFPGYAFRGGPSSLRMQISIAASALPLLIGGGTMLIGAAPEVPIRIRRTIIAAGALVGIVSAALLVRHLLVFRDEAFPETTYRPLLSPWWLLLTPASIGFGWLTRRLPARSLSANVALVVSGAFSLVLTAALGIEYLAARSPYLAYQLGTPRLDSRPSGVILSSIGAGLLLSALWWLRRARSDRAVRSGHRARTTLGLIALTVGIVFFVYVNYVHAYSNVIRAIVSLDRRSGEVQWILQGLEGVHTATDGRNSPATPTPITDGRIVCGYFGTPGLLCAHSNGDPAWSRRDLGYEGLYGAGFSPVIADGILMLVRDMSNGVAVIHALDAHTGVTRWTRTLPTTPTVSGNNRTPIVVEVNGEKVLVLWGMEYVNALELHSGRSLWSYRYMSGGDLVASPISDDRRLYLSDITGTVALDYVDLAAGRNPERWRNKARAGCASPVLSNGMIFTVSDSGIATAIRSDTGETLWRQRLPGQYFASLVASPGAVYFTNSEGMTTVVAADGRFRLIAQNLLGEETMASMAVAGGELFIRSAGHVYAIGGH